MPLSQLPSRLITGPKPPWVRYSCSAAITLLVLTLTRILEPYLESNLISIVIVGVSVISLFCGPAPALGSLAFSCLFLAHFMTAPKYTLEVDPQVDLLHIGLLLVSGLLVVLVGSTVRAILIQAKKDQDDLLAEKRMREAFVDSLTHDLLNPLTAALAGVDLLERHPAQQDLRPKLLSNIRSSLRRASTMIQDLLEANKIRAGEPILLKVEEVDVSELLASALQDYAFQYGNRFVLKAAPRFIQDVDPKGLRRVVDNLVNNAVKYGAPDTPITISLRQDDRCFWLSVHNFGSEIAEKDKPTLFLPFKRLSNALGKRSGWGLGLTLVEAIVHAHGGSIRVDSAPGRGTAFVLRFPLKIRQSA